MVVQRAPWKLLWAYPSHIIVQFCQRQQSLQFLCPAWSGPPSQLAWMWWTMRIAVLNLVLLGKLCVHTFPRGCSHCLGEAPICKMLLKFHLKKVTPLAGYLPGKWSFPQQLHARSFPEPLIHFCGFWKGVIIFFLVFCGLVFAKSQGGLIKHYRICFGAIILQLTVLLLDSLSLPNAFLVFFPAFDSGRVAIARKVLNRWCPPS